MPRPQLPARRRTHDRGVDLNRNYGVEWGGPGTATTTSTTSTYHGPAPFSEPETEAFRRFVRDIQPTVLITQPHVHRPDPAPAGHRRLRPVPDEERLRALGDAMARETDYISQYSYQLYDTTGTTDDYIYDALGGVLVHAGDRQGRVPPGVHDGFIPEYEGRPETDATATRRAAARRPARGVHARRRMTADRPAACARRSSAARRPAGRTLHDRQDDHLPDQRPPDDDGVQNPVQTITERARVDADRAGQRAVRVARQSVPPAARLRQTRRLAADVRGRRGQRARAARRLREPRVRRSTSALNCGQKRRRRSRTRSACRMTQRLPLGQRATARQRAADLVPPQGTATTVTVDVFQTSKGRRIITRRRVGSSGSATGPGVDHVERPRHELQAPRATAPTTSRFRVARRQQEGWTRAGSWWSGRTGASPRARQVHTKRTAAP